MSEELKAALARIACLEGEIAKRDETIARLEPQLNRAIQANYDLREELAACRVAVENCDLFRARIVELESQYQRDVYGLNNEGDPIGGDPAGGYANDNARLRAELAALKAQEPVAAQHRFRHPQKTMPDWSVWQQTPIRPNAPAWTIDGAGYEVEYRPLYAAPVSEAKAQGVVMPERLKPSRYELHDAAVDAWNSCLDEVARLNAAPVQQAEYGDAYQGAREDLAIWKRRALEAEEKVLQQEQIIDHLTSEAQGESRFGEPVVTPDAPCVPDGYVLADKKALGTVLQALVNAPHHIRELQVTRQPVELFSDNPINVLIANYEAPAAPAADAGLVEAFCKVEQALDLIGGIRHGKNVTQDELWQSCELLDAALAAHRAKGVV